MLLPDLFAKPIFHVIYLINRRTIRPLDKERRSAFDNLFDSALLHGPNTLIDYNLPYPKSDFLNYLCDWRGFVMHGSQLTNLDTLQPIRRSRDRSEFGNRQQIFASPDAMWAMWFAILNKSKYNRTRNGCVRVGLGPRRIKHYHFELPQSNKENVPFNEGMIYIARADDFPDKRTFPLINQSNAEIEEWGNTNPVALLARIKVKPEDVPYLNQVQFNLE